MTPTFTAVSAICSGASLAPLPTTSGNGITGTWLPALNNTATTNYTFTPTAGQCALTQTVTITVNPNTITPTFTAVSAICSGASLAPLPTTSGNGIAGTWAPALTNTATQNYTFTPTVGQCALTQTLTITVNPNVTPTFTAVSAICSGASLAPLPTTSGNGITGTWLPALNNTATTNYTFTPTAGLCALTQTVTITVNPNVTPSFTAVPAICSGGTLSALPTTSGNGITGTWAPALNNTTTTNYTFTPTAGQCALTQTLTITVNPNVTPTFTTVAAICAGGTLAPLPGVSGNGIMGTWSPALDNTTTTNYTFTPIVQCALIQTVTITVNPNIAPTFTAVAGICPGATLSPLPTTSGNGIMGTWSPALDNTATTNYTFTPTAGQCALTQTLSIAVNTNVIPTFTAVPAICSGATLAPLPTISGNGITGAWSPSLNNTATQNYTFTPTAGQCALTNTLSITVTPNVTPTFTAVTAICSGGTLFPLPGVSGNGITGTWSPALSNTVTTNYTFTPTAGQCALTQSLMITVNVLPNLSTVQNANTLTASQTGATYQWIDCANGNSVLSGQTGQSFTATASGNYAVIVSNGTCSGTSTCVNITITGIEVLQNSSAFVVYPNPAQTVLNIKTDAVIETVMIYNLLGEPVQAETGSTFSIAGLSSGVYILYVHTKGGSKQMRFIKD